MTEMFTAMSYKDWSEEDLRDHWRGEWEADEGLISRFEPLAASGDLGDYEEGAWFLLRDKESGELFEVSGSHCSCYGFEGQFNPKKTTVKYLLSDKFYDYGLYDKKRFQLWFSEKFEESGKVDNARR